jgi:hypothetical protein
MAASDERSVLRLILITVVSFIVVPGGLTIAIPRLLLSANVEFPGLDLAAVRVLGFGLVVAGLGILGWCSWQFVVFGDGTPNPGEPPRFLVAR